MSAETFLEEHRGDGESEVFGIAELARELQTTARAIRFYEEKGLLRPKRIGTTRVYGRRERARLTLILRAKSLGLTLREIGEYLELYGRRGEGRKQQLEMVVEKTAQMIEELREKRAAMDATIDELKVIRRASQRKLRALSKK